MSNAPGNVQYNYAQLEGIWTQAGGAAGAAPIAAAIAMAESGGNSTATDNDSNGSTDRGLWQINSVHGAQSTYDVMGNARAAIAISNNGQNWGAWTTYNSGAYRQYLQTGVAPDTSAPLNGTGAAANLTANTGPLPGGLKDPLNWFANPEGTIEGILGGAASQATGQVGQFIVKFALQGLITTVLNPFIQIIAGVMGMAAGASMFIIGIWIMAGQTQTGQQAERGAGKAAQAGLSLLGPETTAATQYMGQGGKITTVSQTRKPAGQFSMAGQTFRYRPARVKTSVSREEGATYGDTYQGPKNTKDAINGQAREFDQRSNGNGKRR